jgi:hypothetical protein
MIPRTTQPQDTVGIDWSNPIARGLSFAAIQIGGNFFDCVTQTFGVPNGTVGYDSVYPNNGGKSRDAAAIVGFAGATITNKFEWEVSETLRGAGMVQEGTILALAATSSQVDGALYAMGGNTDAVGTGHGFGLAIDSFLVANRGGIVATDYIGHKNWATTELLGNPFSERLHFFGYAFSGNGTDGDWFAEGGNTTWSGGATHGTTTTNRRARVFALGAASGSSRNDSKLAALLFFDRRILPIEYARLYENSWQLFQGAPRRARVRAPVSAYPTLSAATVTAITATTATPRVTITI